MKALSAATPVWPARPPPAKVPHGTKLGSHSVSVIPPKTTSTPGPIPDKPSSKALCRYSIGCSNARCTFSHPSPAADEKTGMVLSEEACENAKQCKDAECIKSHVSPAASLGESTALKWGKRLTMQATLPVLQDCCASIKTAQIRLVPSDTRMLRATPFLLPLSPRQRRQRRRPRHKRRPRRQRRQQSRQVRPPTMKMGIWRLSCLRRG